MKVIPIHPMSKVEAKSICGSVTQTSKMPCKSYSLPTIACQTGYKMAQIKGSICHGCYANKGFYALYAATVEPAQHARLESLNDANWVSGMVAHIGTDAYFRWHDSGDLASLTHLEMIAQVALATPNCKHWLPTREYGYVKEFIAKHKSVPTNLIIRLSAMYPDVQVRIPRSLRGIPGITASNVHTVTPLGTLCGAPQNDGQCGTCRACWSDVTVSYELH